MLILAALITAVLASASIDFAAGHRRLRFLTDIPPASGGPRVSIVAAARNEARGITAAVRSLLCLDYPDLEIVLVNDRSTDETGALLRRLAAEFPRLIVTDITELPDGWLGKNYALHTGAAAARGDLLLFTDADIVFEPSTLRRAVAYMEAERIDHLAAIPDVRVPGVALNAFIAAFGVFFSLYARPWKARDPASRAHIGIGAFNLVRTAAYRAIGGHTRLAMRPDDDMKLGKVLKQRGFRQDAISGRGLIVVEWYATLGELIDGLMKNAFAGVDYSLIKVAGSTAALLLMNVWPFVAVFVTEGVTRALYAACVLLIVLIFHTSARYGGAPMKFVFAYPVAAVLFAYIIWRSAAIAVSRGAITWRGTAYSLAQMRANRL
jgi:glycosyltransferase involved in cell wall biosynthesis